MEENEVKQVNVKLPAELQVMLDELVEKDGEESDRSKVIRKLIRKEYRRRNRVSPTNERTRPLAA